MWLGEQPWRAQVHTHGGVMHVFTPEGAAAWRWIDPLAHQADVAATLIANAVNIDHPAIQRQAANSLRDDSDLGERLVTVDVPRLAPAQVDQALQLGLDCAHAMQARAQVVAVYLCCQGRTAVTQTLECLV